MGECHTKTHFKSKQLISWLKHTWGEVIIDPFANNNKLATITNDLDCQYDTNYHLDAYDFLKMFEDNSIDTVLYDPPYSPRQVSECYKKIRKNCKYGNNSK